MNFHEWLFNEVIDDSTFIEAAKNISKLLKSGTASRGYISSMLYHALTNRYSNKLIFQKYDNIKHLEEKYHNAMTALRNYFDINGFMSHHNAWFQVDTTNNTRKPRIMNNFKETAKAYWTIEINEENIKNFVNSLTKLANALRQISMNNNDAISFKFPSTLGVLNRHVDSLVIYLGNPRNRDIVEKTVEKIFNEYNVKTQERVHRAKRGFDWKKDGNFDELEPADKIGGSHTELVSHVIATQIVNNANAFVSKSEQEIANWIKAWAKTLASYSPQKIYQQFYGDDKPLPTRTNPYDDLG